MIGVCTTLVGLVKIAEAQIGPSHVDEAVSLTRRYCGAEAPAFVNGVLSAIARDR